MRVEVKELAEKFRSIEVDIETTRDEFGSPIEILTPFSAQALARVALEFCEEREAEQFTLPPLTLGELQMALRNAHARFREQKEPK